MLDNNELVDMLRAVIQDELKPVSDKFTAFESRVDEKLTTIEATVNDIRITDCQTHKELLSHLDYIAEHIKRIEPHEEKAVR